MRSRNEHDVRQRQHRIQPVRRDHPADVFIQRDILGVDADTRHAERVRLLRDLRADASDSDDYRRLAAQFDGMVVLLSELLLLHIGDGLGHVSGQSQQQRESMIGDLGALDDLAVGQHHVAVDEFREAVRFHARAIDVDPLQMLGGTKQLGGNCAEDGVGVGHLRQHFGGLRRDKRHPWSGRLHFRNPRYTHGGDHDLLRLRRKQRTEQCDGEQGASDHIFSSK